jgi:hypothetical protein
VEGCCTPPPKAPLPSPLQTGAILLFVVETWFTPYRVSLLNGIAVRFAPLIRGG